MIEIDYQLLSKEAIDNLIIDFITREATDYGEKELDIVNKKNQILAKLEQGDAVIVYFSQEGYCTIISAEERQKLISETSTPI